MKPLNLLQGRNILLAQRSANLDGSALSGLMTAKAFLSGGARVRVMFGHDGPMQQEYAQIGCQVFTFPHGDWLRPGRVLRSLRRLNKEWNLGRKLARTLKGDRYDLVYVNSLVSMSAAVAAEKLSAPCVWHVRELFSDVGGEMFIPSAGGKKVVRNIINRLSAEVIVNSKAVQQNILGSTPICESSVIYNAASSEIPEGTRTPKDIRQKIGIGTECTIVGIPSTMRPMKGQLFFLEALRGIVDSDSRVIAVFLGNIESAYGEEMRGMVSKLRLDENVRFAGTIKDMSTFYELCDVICVPSVSEPFGRVAIEAFLNGVPVVATAVGGLTEVVEDQVTGLLVNYGDAEGFAKAVLKILSTPALATRISNSAKVLARLKFSEVAYKKNVLRVVHSALSNWKK